MDTISILGSILGIGFLSGIRLYATVLAIGLAVRLGWLELGDKLSQLAVLADTRVLVVAGVLVALEFIADKIPWVDSLWDSVHTVIRPVGAALLGFQALGTSDPAMQAIVAILCGGMALTGHSSKAATRLAANHSPEPFSNIGLSVLEDLFVPVGLWLALQHPVLTLSLLGIFLAVFLWLSPKIFRFLRVELTALAALLRKHFVPEATRGEVLLGVRVPVGPEGVRCVASKSIGGLRHSIGYLRFHPDRLDFVTRRLFRTRTYTVPLRELEAARWREGLLLDELILKVGSQDRTFYVFKTPLQAPNRDRQGADAGANRGSAPL